ncbi:hypothetical protein ACLE2W_06645 [Pseudomonas shahriarae]|uniref:hypothetical protein n=1 Tax=Pseudomonas shahriarae TaxID=2745512 RepID=UPI002076BB11|nr:hypothetical protein [Pseudomonas shahriarae]MCM8559802.1 hypothetical protein [Pseudomonas shahriarae]
MDGLTPSIWFPVVTLVAGLVLKAVFDWLSEGRKDAVERRIRVEKRKEALLMQRIESQRKLLPELQEAISQLMRCAGRVNLSDVQSYRGSGEWGKALLHPELNEASREAFRSVTLYSVRVQNDELRKAISDLSSTCTQITLALSEQQSNGLLADASFKYVAVNEQIGAALRALDASENAVI